MPEQERFLSQFFVRVNGTDLESQLMDELLQVVVDSNLHLPDMFVIRVHDESLKWIEDGPFELGATVEIGAVTT